MMCLQNLFKVKYLKPYHDQLHDGSYHSELFDRFFFQIRAGIDKLGGKVHLDNRSSKCLLNSAISVPSPLKYNSLLVCFWKWLCLFLLSGYISELFLDPDWFAVKHLLNMLLNVFRYFRRPRIARPPPSQKNNLLVLLNTNETKNLNSRDIDKTTKRRVLGAKDDCNHYTKRRRTKGNDIG